MLFTVVPFASDERGRQTDRQTDSDRTEYTCLCVCGGWEGGGVWWVGGMGCVVGGMGWVVGGWDGGVSCKRQVHHSHYLHVNLLVRPDSVFPFFPLCCHWFCVYM